MNKANASKIWMSPSQENIRNQSCQVAWDSSCSSELGDNPPPTPKKILFPKSCFIFPPNPQLSRTKANIYRDTSIESLKDESAIIKIGISALIMKLVGSSGVRELGLSLKEQEKEEGSGRGGGSAVIRTESIPGIFLTPGQRYRAGLVLNTDDITRFTWLKVRGCHVSQGVKWLLVQMACRWWRAVSGHWEGRGHFRV